MNEGFGIDRSLLEEITIRSLGVIDRADVSFKPGLNVITGETGAGKTMLLTALSLILGSKSDPDLVRNGSERLQVSGCFSLPSFQSPQLVEILEEYQPDIEEGRILLTRSVSKDGKSRAHLSGVSTTASALNRFGSALIEIHGQHGSLSLMKGSRQRDLLDLFGGKEVSQALEVYKSSVAEFIEARIRFEELRAALSDRQSKIKELKDLAAEYSRLKPRPGELEELDSLISRLESVEDLRLACESALSAIADEESGGKAGLQSARRALNQARGKDTELDSFTARVEELSYLLDDVISELSSYREKLEADPYLLEKSVERRIALQSFGRKFGSGEDRFALLSSAITSGLSATERIEDLSGGDERLEHLASTVSALREQVNRCDKALTKARLAAAEELSRQVIEELKELAMPNANFKVEVTSQELDKDSPSLHGGAVVEMLFSAHVGGSLMSISKAASGGELSRLMLAIEVVIAKDSSIGTFLFDEIDAGIGGKAALEVGRRLKRLSESSQVIVVTHLPQVAIWADHHLRVLKNEAGVVTESSVISVSGVEREVEIARMLSGQSDSEHAQEHARELLEMGKA